MSSDAPIATLKVTYFEEPLLLFGGGGVHVDPKAGIARHGPRSLGTSRHPAAVRVGVIGTADTTSQVTEWLTANADGINGTEKHPEFPGFKSDRGFFSALGFDTKWNELITQTEVQSVAGRGPDNGARFGRALEFLDSKLKVIAERDVVPDYVVLALPDSVISSCRTADLNDPSRGLVHRDLRRAIKGVAMRYRLPVQLVRQQTIDGRDRTPRSKIAWNFMSGLYFKAGGAPWAPYGLTPGTCYIGVSFFRPLGSRTRKMQTSLVQAFDEHGEGLVLRGHDFEWDPDKEGTATPHLTAEQAHALIRMVIDRYQLEMKQPPQRVVVHKRSRFWTAEREGFQDVLKERVERFDLVALTSQSRVRLLPVNAYPALRGTRFSVGDLDYLYTTGFISALNEFHAMHVPSPLQIADHVGQDTARDTLLREILALTKMNWNSTGLGGASPITLKFSELVGDIMKEIPPDVDPLPQYKFYM